MSARPSLLHACVLAASSVLATAAAAHGTLTPAAAASAFGELADAWVAASMAILFGLYLCGIRRLRRAAPRSAGIPLSQAACFHVGLATLAVALLSPLDTLGGALFSLHMVQHELLMLVAAPLLVAGRPLAVFLWAFTPPWRMRIARLARRRAWQLAWSALNRPSLAWSLQALTIWAWHMPGLFQAGLADEAVHTAQHFGFLLTALLFWWSLLGRHSRLRNGGALLYVLGTAIHTGVLGALLTFSPRAWYPAYGNRAADWGLTLLEDQQLGGLIMWVPAGFVFVLAGLAFAARAIAPQASRAAPAMPRAER